MDDDRCISTHRKGRRQTVRQADKNMMEEEEKEEEEWMRGSLIEYGTRSTVLSGAE